MIRRIAIIGTGLIGGSLGLALKRAQPDLHIIGCDNPDVLARAIIVGAIDDGEDDLEKAVQDADLIIIATPLSASLRVLQTVAEHAPSGSVITDVGSVKRPIVDCAREVISPEQTFVGGHPMAGAAAGGIEHADPMLFENAVYALCPPDGELTSAFKPTLELLEAIGARILVIDPDVHDRAAAAVSHLPQLMAVLLVQTAHDFGGDDDLVRTLGAGGFRDMTRIAESSFDIWQGILAANHGHVLDTLAGMSAAIQRLRNRLIEEDYDEIRRTFDAAAARRRAIPRDMRGFLHPLHNIIVQAEDKPGVLQRMTTMLGESGVNIKDIELLKIREGTGGAFRLGFEQRGEAEEAIQLLNAGDFRARPL